MNTPILRGGRVYKDATPASDTIHALIRHVRAKGLSWVPESFGVNDDGKHVWEYIEGEAVHGLIDFDVCSPGSRLWDIAYTVYRFVPVQPPENEGLYGECSPFASVEIIKRLELFLAEYSGEDRALLYDVSDVLQLVARRLSALASWSEAYSIESNNDDLAEMRRCISCMQTGYKAYLYNVIVLTGIISIVRRV